MKRYDFSGINREVQRRMELGNTHHSLEGERMAEKMLLIPGEELEQILGRQLLESTFDWAASNLGDQRIRSIKNGLITLISQVCRASMKYGVDPEFAFTLSDYYIGYLETLNDQHKLMELMRGMMIHYNMLVRDANAPQYSRRINRAVEYISRELYMPVRVSDVAAYAGLEPHYFSAVFKKETGLAPGRYILLKKLEAAKDLLDSTQNTVLYIAESLGFCDASHFEKRFRKEYGVTPSEYRNRPMNDAGSEKDEYQE